LYTKNNTQKPMFLEKNITEDHGVL
jgi:hypothetical protein